MYACGYSHVAIKEEVFHHNIKVVAVYTNTMCNRRVSNIPGTVSVTGEDTSQLTKACSDSVYVR